jgi:hypothetical protein
MRFHRLVVLCVILVCCSQTLKAHQDGGQQRAALTNADIVSMLRAKFDDATIIKMIQEHNANYDLSVDAMIRLKQAGATQAVLRAMIDAGPGSKNAASADTEAPAKAGATSSSGLPDEIGVYVRQKSGLVAIEPEIVNWQTGGVLKHAATLGLDHEHVNGTVTGPHSGLTATSSPGSDNGAIEFVIRCPEGNSASEYQLLRFWEKSDRREFRSITGGVLHASGGAKNNVIPFHFEKLAPYTYKVELPAIEPGEYGFLAPGMAASADLASRGKVYTFRIIE